MNQILCIIDLMKQALNEIHDSFINLKLIMDIKQNFLI